MKNLKILIFVLSVLLVLASCGNGAEPETPFSLENTDFSGCKVEVLEHAIYGGGSLGELNAADTEYFVNIMTAIELGDEVSKYSFADGESARQYLITLKDGDEIYFGQGFGEAEGYENSSFVHINGRVYVIENPAVLNALYVINERFSFYDRISSAIDQ